MSNKYQGFTGLLCVVLVFTGSWARAVTLTGLTYTYDLSVKDIDPGGYPVTIQPYVGEGGTANDTVDVSNQSAITTLGRLTDGELGSIDVSDPVFGCCLFNNGTYAGFRGDPGIGQAPKPKINVPLGGEYALDSFTLYYLVEDSASIYSPRRVPDSTAPLEFNAVTVYGSANGVDFTELGFSNDTHPLFGLDGDVGSGLSERRSLTIALGGAHATHLSIDVRSPWTYVFLSEIVIDGTTVGGVTGDYNGNSAVDAADYALWRGTLGSTTNLVADGSNNGVVDQADYGVWRTNFGLPLGAGSSLNDSPVPEPSAITLMVVACGWAIVRCNVVRRRQRD